MSQFEVLESWAICQHVILNDMKSIFVFSVIALAAGQSVAAEFDSAGRPLLAKYCFECHSGDAPNGDVDFESIKSADDVVNRFDLLERGIEHLKSNRMPPKDADQPTKTEREAFYKWAEEYLANIKVRPAEFKPRRLSVNEYRNTLRSVFGFDLRVAIIEAEQTLAERSMVIKLMPTDPPGESGFKNDTHRNRLTTVAWDQYSYLADATLQRLFSPIGKKALERLAGPVEGQYPTHRQAVQLIRRCLELTQRRPPSDSAVAKSIQSIDGKSDAELVAALRFELKTMLMSPQFLFRGLLAVPSKSGRQKVDSFELAERLSFFLWADMPDDRLRSLAADASISKPEVLTAEIDRMLKSPKARSLANVFATEWFTLNEIEFVSDNPPVMLALKSQPIDFMNYLFTRDRPLLELIDSKTAFINPHTARYYGQDSKQMTRYRKQKGIEVEAVANQQIKLQSASDRGGLLTMAGILAMNKGPIQRGTWMMERIMGEHLPDPPPDVGQVQPNRGDEKLTFRQRFEQHRSNPTCAVCHDKIDPLGFAFQSYDVRGSFIKAKNYKPNKRDIKKGLVSAKPESRIDTSGQLPTGERFDDINGLKRILQTSQRKVVIRNIVRRTLSYALCRKLMIYDRPTIESITEKMDRENGTWRDLFITIATSVPFQETIK